MSSRTTVFVLALLFETVAISAVARAAWAAHQDWCVVKAAEVMDARYRYARERVRRELIRFAEMSAFLAITLILWANLRPDRQLNDWLGVVLGLFVAALCLTAVNSVLDLRLWRWLRRKIVEDSAGDNDDELDWRQT